VMKKIIIVVLVGLLLVEGGLQLLARRLNPYGSYAEFFEMSKSRIRGSDPSQTIFFVGDSTIFGGGASDEKLFSLPAQFQNLLKRAGSVFKVQNLGYPGTTGKEHLEVLRLLPDKAKVVMRTGINDSWKRHDSYKIRVFGQYVEFRLLKLAMILWYGWNRDANAESATAGYNDELQFLATQKRLDLYFVDYFLGEKTFMNSYFEGASNFIPLAKILLDAGFSDPGGFISRRFLSFDLVHANDLGYRLQAQAVFNWFAQQEKIGLEEEDIVELAVDDNALQELRSNLKQWLSRLKNTKESPGDLFPFVMKAAWQVYAVTGDQEVYDLYEALGKVYVFAFHSIYPITYVLNRQDTMITSDHYEADETRLSSEDINSGFQIIRVLRHRSTHDYVTEYLEKFAGIVKMDRVYSDYTALDPPFPLELCKKFLMETGFPKERVKILKSWKTFFGKEFDLGQVAPKNWEVCGGS